MDLQTVMLQEAHKAYPSHEEVDQWAEQLLRQSETVAIHAEFVDYCPITVPFGNSPNTLVNKYVKFTASDNRQTFYGYWQPAIRTPAPLLINLPGYGSSISMHPQLADQGFHILHISPLGYAEPNQIHPEMQLPDGNWPVLDRTARGLKGGYADWLSDCLLAIRWALQQPGVLPQMSLFGTSQGGGGSLLLASILGGKVRCVCADLPFLTDFPATELEGPAYSILKPAYEETDHTLFWNQLGYVDTLSHAHRINVPVMLSAGGLDNTCPPKTIEHLFSELDCTKQYTFSKNVVHTHSRESMVLFSAWLHLYA